MSRFDMFGKIKNSIVFRIGSLMAAMTIMALLSMFTSFVVSEMASSDAAAINLSGSLRMQGYALLSYAREGHESQDQFKVRLDQFEQTLQNPVVVYNVNRLEPGDEVYDQYNRIKRDWVYNIRPRLMAIQVKSGIDNPLVVMPLSLQDMDRFVEDINVLVGLYQSDAEFKIEMLRLIQIISLFVTLLLVFIAMGNVSRHIETPLHQLTEMAKRMRDGDLKHTVELENNDELGVLADSFNSMSAALAQMYEQLEDKVENKTKQLKQSNDILQFLFETARHINDGMGAQTDFDPILEKVSQLSGIKDMDLCLSTDKSSTPYIHLLTLEDSDRHDNCDAGKCDECVGDSCFVSPSKGGYNVKFPLVQEGQNYGVLVARVNYADGFSQWQHDLIQSVADQISIALSLENREKLDRRMGLLNERTIIARELHDSLAQSLSYLKIQVMRLQKGHEKGIKEEAFQELIGELREGLGGAYRQLRELLSTFRLQIDGSGLKGAMNTAFNQLGERSDMEIKLNYQIDSVMLNPNEEIHLLQICKEATQNAIYHSKGSKVQVDVLVDNGDVHMSILDDGVGIPDDPNKVNHYGLAIMSERSRHLGGEVSIKRHTAQGGTLVELAFTPSSRAMAVMQ